jgi:hypothetical protein
MVEESQAKEKKRDQGLGGQSLKQAKVKYNADKEARLFPYQSLLIKKPEDWDKIAEFYGIREDFPCE